MEDMEDEEKTVVLDNGSYCTKIGFNGDEFPRVVPTVIGYPKYESQFKDKDVFYGLEIEKKSSILNIKHLMNRLVMKNWDNMEKFWNYIFEKELNIYPADYNILITQPLNNPKTNKEKVLQIMFENFYFKGFYLSDSPTLSLYKEGKFTGFCMDLGDGSSQFCPIYEGYKIIDRAERINIGGKDITKSIQKLLSKKKYDFAFNKKIVNDIKEKSCYIASYYEEEIKTIEQFDYELPDGSHAIVDKKRIKYPEAFIFNPSLKYMEGKGIAEKCYEIINKCEMDIKKDLYNQIILSGGNSMFKGLPERFGKEIRKLVPPKMEEEINVVASPERKFGAWIGGTILANISTFKKLLITKEEYEENGSSYIIEKKNI